MVIYKTIHLTTGKFYIGRDKHNNPQYFGSGTDIKSIIKTEGKINLKKIILEECNKNTLSEREEYWLNYYNAEDNPKCYNRTNKAYGCSRQTKEGKIKISKALKGKKRSKETCKKMSLGRINHPMYTDEWKEKIRKARKGIMHSSDTKFKMSENKKGNGYRRKEVLQFTKNNKFITSFPSALEAAKSLGKKQGAAITEVCNGKRKSIFGFIWKYQK